MVTTTQKNKFDLEIPPFEAVGVVCAQSIGEPGTQMSISAEEKVLVRIGSDIRSVPIGNFVDGLIQKYGSANATSGSRVCDIPSLASIFVPSLDQKAKVMWKPLVQVSRHKTNKKLLKLSTRSGRSIIATGNHSFVIRKDGVIMPIVGSALKIRDRIPVVKNLTMERSAPVADLSVYLPKTNYWFGSELKKAASLGKDYVSGFGSAYQVPVGPDQLANHISGRNDSVEDGFVYPYMNHSRAGMPEQLPLDKESGWFIGAYLSEGNATKSYVNISNTDEKYLARARGFAAKLGFTVNEYGNDRGFSHGHDLRVNSTVLSDFMKTACGHGSAEKRVPAFAFGAGTEFIGALLRAYFDGDGNINVERKVIRAHSKSKELIDGISLLLNRIGIFATKHSENSMHVLVISHRYAGIFKEKIGSDLGYKAKAVDSLCRIKNKDTCYDVVEMVVGFGSMLKDVSTTLGVYKKDAFSAGIRKFTRKQKIGRETLGKYVDLFASVSKKKNINIDKELRILRGYLTEDVVWDEIVRVDEYVPENKTVYDFSVPGLETFTTSDGIITHNTMRTFHFAGVAEHVPTGLPRLIEIVDAKKEPKKSIIDIYLKKDHSKKSEDAEKVARELSSVFVKDVALVEDDLENLEVEIRFSEKDGKALGITMNRLKEALGQFDGTLKVGERSIRLKPANPKDKDGKEKKKLTAKAVRKLTQKVREALVRGVGGISRAVVLKNNNEYFIRAGGFNIIGACSHAAVDPDRVYTNNIKEIERVYGIEAARSAIIKETSDVLEMQKLSVDIRHIMLISDAMTYAGAIKAIGRHGLSGEKVGVLGRAAFEETIKHLINASAFSEEEKLIGVTENIIVGQTVPVGTGKIVLVMKNKRKKE